MRRAAQESKRSGVTKRALVRGTVWRLSRIREPARRGSSGRVCQTRPVQRPPSTAGHASRAAIEAAAADLDGELGRAPLDPRFRIVLRGCARGGQHALRAFCDVVEDPAQKIDELPAISLLHAVATNPPAAARAMSAAFWMMAAQRIAETWPGSYPEVIQLARGAMALGALESERVDQLAMLVAEALLTPDPGDREGKQFQFTRESLETIVGAAMGSRPARRDMLHVIPHWRACFVAGIAACDALVRELGGGGN